MTTAIIGSGFAGMAAAHGLNRLGKPNTVYESKAQWGGHTHADNFDGFWFDEGPHLSFTKDTRVYDVFSEGAEQWEELPARVTNYFEGKWLTHPAQVHLYGLDADLITNCVVDLVETLQNPPDVVNYEDWLVASFGRTFAETFPSRYTRKYWTLEPRDMSIDWVGSRMYPPKLNEVLKGALAPENKGDFHYLKSFRYPSKGGYQSFMNKLAEGVQMQLNKEVVEVDVTAKTLRFADGTTASYENLVSTMPLDLLVPRITGREVPADVLAAANDLVCSSVVLVDIAVDRADLFDHEWYYVYDEDISISRVHFPHMLSPSMAPEGKGSVQAEIYYSRFKPLDVTLEGAVERAIDEFIRMGILRNRDEIIFAKARDIKYANVIFDHKRKPAVEKILPFIEECGIELAGRYGEWKYLWTDDSTLAGWNAAAKIGGTDVDSMFGESK